MFLPFILAILLRACVTFNLNNFFLYYKDCQSKLNLSTKTKELLKGIAKRQGFV
jgi:hypothetical protein